MTVGELKAKLDRLADWLPVVVEVDGEYPGIPVEVERTAYYVRGACSQATEDWLAARGHTEFAAISCESPDEQEVGGDD